MWDLKIAHLSISFCDKSELQTILTNVTEMLTASCASFARCILHRWVLLFLSNQDAVCKGRSAMCNVQCTIRNVQCEPCNVQWPFSMYNAQCAKRNVQSAMCKVQCGAAESFPICSIKRQCVWDNVRGNRRDATAITAARHMICC